MAIRILLAEDHTIVRRGLAALLEKKFSTEVVGEAKDGREAVRMAKDLKPRIVIMDVSMPGMNGIEATRQIVKDNPDTRVIGLSMHYDHRFISEMLIAGASGYLIKDSAFDELSDAINSAVAGEIYLSSAITGIVVEELRREQQGRASGKSKDLSPREKEVLQLLAEGKATKAIASTLNVSEKTVETHRRQIREKLGISSIAELTKYAIRHGLTSLEK